MIQQRASQVSSSRGQSLVEMLVGIGILSVVLLALSTMMSSTYFETRALSEKLAALDLERMLIYSLADGAVCRYVLNNPNPVTFDSTALPQTITLPDPAVGVRPALYSSLAPGPAPGPVLAQVDQPTSDLAPTVVVSSIQLQISQGSSGSYRANWLVTFDNTRTARPLKPVSVATVLAVDDVTNPNQATISKCSGTSVGGPSRMPYYKMYYDLGNICASTPAGVTKMISGAWAGGNVNKSYFARPYASVLLEMTVRAPSPTTVTQYVPWVDDQVYFYLNGNLVDSAVGAGTHNRTITWNLPQGDNLIQIVSNDCWWAAGHEGLALYGDFFARHPELEFIP